MTFFGTVIWFSQFIFSCSSVALYLSIVSHFLFSHISISWKTSFEALLYRKKLSNTTTNNNPATLIFSIHIIQVWVLALWLCFAFFLSWIEGLPSQTLKVRRRKLLLILSLMPRMAWNSLILQRKWGNVSDSLSFSVCHSVSIYLHKFFLEKHLSILHCLLLTHNEVITN